MKKTKNRRWLTAEDKANIVLARDARTMTGKTARDLAEDFRCSEWTINHTTRDNISSDARKIYEERKKELSGLAVDVTVAALEKGRELIEVANSPQALSGIAAVGKFADQIHRLEMGKPTEIRSASAEDHALEFIKDVLLIRTGSLELALATFEQVSLEPLVPDHRRGEIAKRIRSGDLQLI